MYLPSGRFRRMLFISQPPWPSAPLLILAALCCFGAGVGIAGTNSLSSGHVIDYTFEDHTAEDSSQVLPNIKAALKENGLENQFSELLK